MSLIKDAVANVFSSLNYTREEREKKFRDAAAAMVNAVNDIVLHHAGVLLEELENFDEDNWIVGIRLVRGFLFRKNTKLAIKFALQL